MIYGSGDITHARKNFLSFWAITCPFTPLPNNPEDIIRTSWRYYHFTHKNHRSKSYAWFLRYGVWQTELFLILDHFLPFYPSPSPYQPKGSKFWKKWKKKPRDIIILHKCTITIIWQSYDIWFLRYQLQDIFFCYLGPFFALLPPTAQKMKISKHEN